MIKEKKGWEREEFLKFFHISPYAWHQGFYPYRWNNEIWKRNFTELQLRDIAVFTLGDLREKKILDVGCGQEALYLLTFLKMGASVGCGQDISPIAVDRAIERCTSEGFKCDIKIGDCTKLNFPDDSFDIVFSGDVFEHITERQKDDCIKEIYRVLKPGGLVTIKSPNKDYLKMSLVLKRINALLKLKNPFKVHIAHTKNNPDCEHHGLTTYRELKKQFLNNTFHEPVVTHTVLHRKGLPVSFSKLFLQSKYFNEHIIMTARKPIFYGLYK
jgi:ubiquinone/menaquinone biosynthesis C-methylase UbiE